MANEITYTLTGHDAVTAMLLNEIRDLWWDDSTSIGRLEFYLMQAMCSDALASWEVSRKKIVAVANAMHDGYIDRYDNERINSAFRKLTRRKFLYGATNSRYSRYGSYRKRCYGLKLSKYD